MSYTSGDPITRTNLILDLLAKKQQSIGANIANVNTPGYERQDFDFKQFLNTANGPLETELSTKLGPSPFATKKGGRVSTGQELIEMQKASLFYTIATKRMTSIITELKTVTQVGK